MESSDAIELWWIDEELIVCLLIVPLAGGEFWGRVQFCEGRGGGGERERDCVCVCVCVCVRERERERER